MDKNIKICIYPKEFNRKPTGAETGVLSQIIGENHAPIKYAELKFLVKAIGSRGCTFTTATFKNRKRNKENFEQQQLFALDFDGGISFEEIQNRAKDYNLPILFAYDTFRSKNHNRFRIVFLNDVSVHDPKVAETMLKGLHTIFPEADPACKDISRMYFGGKELLYFDASLPEINIADLFMNLSLHLKDKYGPTHYKRELAKFSNDTGIALTGKGFLDVSVTDEDAKDIGMIDVGKNSPKTIMLINTDGEKLPRSYSIQMGQHTSTYGEKKSPKIHKPHRSKVLEHIRTKCKLYQEFESGSRRLPHMERAGLATNIIHIESGASAFAKTLRLNNYYPSEPKKYGNWDYYLKYFQQMYDSSGCSPQRCEKFCPHKDKCDHGKNILSSVSVGYHQMERLANYVETFVPLSEAEANFEKKFISAMQAQDTQFHILKAQTALGKTETILRVIKNSGAKILIAVPTNILKHEVFERAAAMDIEMVESPSIREFKDELPDHIWQDVEQLYASGKSVMPYINKIIDEDGEGAKLFKRYKRELEEFNDADGCVITTHKRLLNMDTSKYDVVIVDEDIIFNSIIPNNTDISRHDLKQLLKKLTANDPLAVKIKKMFKSLKTKEFFKLPRVTCNRKSYDGINIGVDIPSLCAATHFCYREDDDCVSFYNKVKFDEDTKFIMVSATVDETICGYYFGDRVNFHECAKAKYEGTLNQYYDRSMSRSAITKDPAIIDRIKKWSGFKHTISYKTLHLNNLYFGNLAGCDYLKGENIDVIGTHHQPEWKYKLFAHALNLDADLDEKLKPHKTVTHNGYRFKFTTYDDEILRSIQFYMLESESEQAVGRARLLRCPEGTVYLYSNFPLCQANMKESEYEQA